MSRPQKPSVFPYDVELLALYKKLGFISADGHPKYLPLACEKSVDCWSEAAQPPSAGELAGSPPNAAGRGRFARPHRYPMTTCAGEISPPWIGPNYEQARLMVVLANLHDYGGCDFAQDAQVGMRFLATSARHGFAASAKRLFGGSGYQGTMVWAQVTHYAAAWLDVLGHLPARTAEDGWFAPEVLTQAIDGIAIVQHVKCSPRGNRSAPTAAMWRSCGKHVLADELEILRPKAVIVAGTSDNWPSFWSMLAPKDHGFTRRAGGGSFIEYSRRTSTRGRDLEVLVVPHPASFGAASHELVAEVHKLLRAVQP